GGTPVRAWRPNTQCDTPASPRPVFGPPESLGPDLDHTARMAEAVAHLGFAGIQEAQLADILHGDLAQATDTAILDPVQIDVDIPCGWIHDADGTACMQPSGPELLNQRIRVECRRTLELLLREDAGVANAQGATPALRKRTSRMLVVWISWSRLTSPYCWPSR